MSLPTTIIWVTQSNYQKISENKCPESWYTVQMSGMVPVTVEVETITRWIVENAKIKKSMTKQLLTD